METNVIEIIRSLCNAAEADGGLDSKFELKVSQVKSLLGSLSEQEREILGLERHHESLLGKVQKLVEGLDCYLFSEFTPDEESDNDVFEVFVGTLSDNGRIFAIWDAGSGAFHEPTVDGGQIIYLDDVIYWRYSLPEPHESVDLGEEI